MSSGEEIQEEASCRIRHIQSEEIVMLMMGVEGMQGTVNVLHANHTSLNSETIDQLLLAMKVLTDVIIVQVDSLHDELEHLRRHLLN